MPHAGRAIRAVVSEVADAIKARAVDDSCISLSTEDVMREIAPEMMRDGIWATPRQARQGSRTGAGNVQHDVYQTQGQSANHIEGSQAWLIALCSWRWQTQRRTPALRRRSSPRAASP